VSERYGVGIDLGTSTSEVCIYRDGREPYVVPDPLSKSPIVPSLVALDKKDRVQVGENARPYVDAANRGVREIKRLMGQPEKLRLGDSDYRPEELAAHILMHMKQIASEFLGEPVQDVVITVPANFDDVQRKATDAAARIAGLNVLRWISEPTAAALAFGVKEEDAEGQVLVFDFGGGTLDITILEMMEGVLDVKATYGDTALGGKDMDEAVARLILDKFLAENPGATLPAGSLEDASSALARALKDRAEKAKKALSSDVATTVSIDNFAQHAGRSIDLDVDLTREEFEHAVAGLLVRARACLTTALRAKDTRPSYIDKVLLVGGTTYIPCVRRLVAEMLPVHPVSSVDPDLAVAIGASIRAAIVLGFADVHIVDTCSHGFGIEVVGLVGSQQMLMYDQLISPNSAIPYSVERDYSLMTPDQREVEVSLFQSHDGTARFPHEAKEIQAMVIEDIPPALYGEPHPIKVEFSYSIDGQIELKAWIPGVNKSCMLRAKPHEGVIEESELVLAAQRVLVAWQGNPKAARYEALIERAEGVMEGADDETRQKISGLVADLKIALSQDDDAVETAGDALTDYLFDLEQ
jgi:molecular chaperone DnaK